MKTVTTSTDFERRAADVLTAMLGRVSAIRLMELRRESRAGRSAAIVARVQVLGHDHMLSCELDPGCEPGYLRAVLREIRSDTGTRLGDAIPVVIAPYLSREAQTLCKENRIGFLDFEGNARLTIGDYFMGTRAMPRERAAEGTAAPQKSTAVGAVDRSFPGSLQKLPQKHMEVALSA